MARDLEVLAALIEMRRLYSKPGTWTQEAFALSDEGEEVHVFYNGTRRCLVGTVAVVSAVAVAAAVPLALSSDE